MNARARWALGLMMRCATVDNEALSPACPVLDLGRDESIVSLKRLERQVVVPRFYGIDPSTRRHTVDCSVRLTESDKTTLVGEVDLSICKEHPHVYLMESVELRQCNGTHNGNLTPATLSCWVNGVLSSVRINAYGRTDRAVLIPRRRRLNTEVIECFMQAQQESPPSCAVITDGKVTSPYALNVLLNMDDSLVSTTRTYANAVTATGELAPNFVQQSLTYWDPFKAMFSTRLNAERVKDGRLLFKCVCDHACEGVTLNLLVRIVVIVM